MGLKDHLEKLIYFYEVAKCGSIKQAASISGRAQPSITKAVKVLEDSLGCDLFLRKPRGVELTIKGEILFKYCHSLFSGLEDVEKKISAPQGSLAGSIRVGTYDSIAIYFWPEFLNYFMKKCPEIDLNLMTGRSDNIQKMVEGGELDFALIIEPKPTSSLNVFYLMEDSFYVYQSTKNLNFELSSPPFIYMPDALAGEGYLKHFLKSSPLTKKEFKTSSLESIKALTVQGVGRGLLPKMVAESAIREKKIEKVEQKGWPREGLGKHRVGLVYPKAKKDSWIIQNLIKEIQSFIC